MSFEAFIPPSVENPNLNLDKNKESIEIERKYTQDNNSPYKTIKKIETKSGRKEISFVNESDYEDDEVDASFTIEKNVTEQGDDLNIDNKIKETEEIIKESEEESLQSTLTDSDHSSSYDLDIANQIEDAEKSIDKLSLNSVNIDRYALDVKDKKDDYSLPDYSSSYDLNKSNANWNLPGNMNEIRQKSEISISKDKNNYSLGKLIPEMSKSITQEISEKIPSFKDKIAKVAKFVTSNEDIMKTIFGKKILSSMSTGERSEIVEMQQILTNKAYEEILKQLSEGVEYSDIKEAFKNPTIENITPLIVNAINKKSIKFEFKTEDANLQLGIGKDNISFAFEMNFDSKTNSVQKEHKTIEKLRDLELGKYKQVKEEI